MYRILYRINSQSRALEEALRREKIPYKIIGGVEFYRRKEIKDIIGYLRILANHHDEESLLRIMNYPQRGIGNTCSIQYTSSILEVNSCLIHMIKSRIIDKKTI